jgi:hypothetical protein
MGVVYIIGGAGELLLRLFGNTLPAPTSTIQKVQEEYFQTISATTHQPHL